MKDNILWVEKYRPDMIEDCILPDSTKDIFQSIVESGELPNLLLFGTSGVGKTTVAKALCNQLKTDWLMINLKLNTKQEKQLSVLLLIEKT